jgi:hypothetical protein
MPGSPLFHAAMSARAVAFSRPAQAPNVGRSTEKRGEQCGVGGADERKETIAGKSVWFAVEKHKRKTPRRNGE